MDTTLKRNIMRRVFFVYFLKKLASPLGLKIYILSIFSWQLFANVSVSNVIANAPWMNISGSVSFFSYAFTNTAPLIQVIILGSVLSLLFIFKEFIGKQNHSSLHQNRLSI